MTFWDYHDGKEYKGKKVDFDIDEIPINVNGTFLYWGIKGDGKEYIVGHLIIKDGEQDGKFTKWYENGQKQLDGNLKDGEQDGKFTEWYENGQKWSEGTFKDGKLISGKRWNEDGSVKE